MKIPDTIQPLVWASKVIRALLTLIFMYWKVINHTTVIPMSLFRQRTRKSNVHLQLSRIYWSGREITFGFEWSFSICLTMKFKWKTWHRNNNSAIFTPKSFVLVGDVSDQLLVSSRICSFALQRYCTVEVHLYGVFSHCNPIMQCFNLLFANETDD